MHVVATAGHVDHGKSTLVHALTGTDPDRFAEEKRRGLTIDLGFAWASLPSGREVAFVDVPGHSRFIRNMLAGVGTVECCLFVVAATEGWKPQSEEHLRILELVGVTTGVIALTKVGVADEELRAIARADVVEHVADSFLADAPIVEVDAVAGVGLAELASSLDHVVRGGPTPVDLGRPRLWIDRAFVMRGSGTVVTGTLAGGPLRAGSTIGVVPGGRQARVRSLQSLKRDRDAVSPGSRVAVNLSGVSVEDVRRGHALVQPEQWRPTRVVDASFRALVSIGHDVTRRGSYTMHVGTAEQPVRLAVMSGHEIRPGDPGIVRLRLPVELPLVLGDRFVLREDGRNQTLGGGEVLDVAPVLPLTRARPSRDVDRIIAEHGWIDVDDLEAMTAERRQPTIDRWVVSPGALEATIVSVREAIRAAGPLGHDVSLLDEHQRAVLTLVGDAVVEHSRVRDRTGESDPLTDHPVIGLLEAEPFHPPDPVGVDRVVLRELVRRGRLVERDGIWFAASAIEQAAGLVADLLESNPDGFTAAEARNVWSTTRKYALPLLAELDASGVTRRRGDVRIAGPRLPKRNDA